jgi:predicted dehydrogenase
MKVLICGLGNMGRIHAKYLNQLGIDWSFYDPYNTNSKARAIHDLKMLPEDSFTHIIISSNEDQHFINYKQIRESGFTGPIMVEKPAVTDKRNFSIFEDPKLSVGLVERFNPAVQVLKENIEMDKLISCDFIRCSIKNSSNKRVNTFVDVGIHDIDLYFYLFDEAISFSHLENFSDTYTLMVRKNNGFISRFLWSNETSCKERKITIRHNNFTLEADLINQVVIKTLATSDGKMLSHNLYVEKASPVLCQLKDFINTGKTYVGKKSHEFYFNLKETHNV